MISFVDRQVGQCQNDQQQQHQELIQRSVSIACRRTRSAWCVVPIISTNRQTFYLWSKINVTDKWRLSEFISTMNKRFALLYINLRAVLTSRRRYIIIRKSFFIFRVVGAVYFMQLFATVTNDNTVQQFVQCAQSYSVYLLNKCLTV